ncbi:PulJ/GspJ family protein [Brevibacillus ginsengisoli]|uniref:PulJ/GspJ family protein n=1 Tax=Brevibacillus ginsengisoli TaxID=363854 RepID=UPI003CEEF325
MMKKIRQLYKRIHTHEEGLTLVELLAGLFLFSTVITMLYGVLHSGYSLKNKVTQQTTILNNADVLVNSVLLSLRNVDEVIDVKPFFDAGKTIFKSNEITDSIDSSKMPISAIWTTQIVNGGTRDQTRVSYLYTIVPDGTAIPPAHQHYKLMRERYNADRGTYLAFLDTNYGSSSGKPPDETRQISDPRFPILGPFTGGSVNSNGSGFLLNYKHGYDTEHMIDITFTLCEYNADMNTESAPFEFRSRVSIN